MSAIKRAVAEKIWKLLGELKQGSDGSLTMRIGLRSGGSAQLLWRKFQVAYTQRKLIVTFDDAGMNLVIPGRGPGSYGVDMEGEDPSIVASVDSGLRDDVMKLAKANPEMRVHLVPLLQKTAAKASELKKGQKVETPQGKGTIYSVGATKSSVMIKNKFEETKEMAIPNKDIKVLSDG